MSEPIRLVVVFTGDSANYHKFQVVDGDDGFVGSIYVPKQSEHGIPIVAEISFVTPSGDKGVWQKGVSDLLDKARNGSKAEQKLIKILKSYK